MEPMMGVLSEEELDMAIAKADAMVKRLRTHIKWAALLGFGITAVLLLVLLVCAIAKTQLPEQSWTLLTAYAVLSGLVTAVYLFVKQVKASNAVQEAEVLHARKLIATHSTTSTTTDVPVSYFDKLVDINVTNLGAYYSTVKFHANNSFMVTMAITVAGFLFIIAGLTIGLVRVDKSVVAYVSAGSGVLVEFISGVFFYLYNKTVRQLKEYHDSLLAVQNILLSFKMVGDIGQENERVKMIGQMIGYLVAIKKTEPEIVPAKVLAKAA